PTARLAGRQRLHRGGDGGDRCLLETGVEHPQRRPLRADPGQCRAHQGGAGPQDGHERGDVDRRPGGVRSDPTELRTGRAASRTALAAAHPQAIVPRAGEPCAALQKTLEEANIKLASVISDILGVNGRRLIEAMIPGVCNPHRLAGLADRRLKASPKQLYDALHGRLTDHHRFLLRLHLGQYDTLGTAIGQIDRQVDTAVATLDAEAAAGQASFRALIALLSTIPGVSTLPATTILPEIA